MALAITGLGMISSLGWDAIASCAAIRAGITRPRPLPSFTVLDEETQATVPLQGHPLHGYTEGFGPLARWVRLALGALDDLLRQRRVPGPEDMSFWRRTRLICITPLLDAERFFEVRQVGADGVKAAYAQLLQGRLLKRLPVQQPRLLDLGHAGLAAALQEAEKGISRAEAERYLLVAVDSYLDVYTLEWLAERRRLKTGSRPTGLMPGEAGACLLVESMASARHRSVPVEAVLESAAVARAPETGAPDIAKRGTSIARAVDAVLQGSSAGRPFEGDVITDLNGEVWRAGAWGHARVRLAKSLGERVRLVTFCASIGEVGASSGAVAACLATRSFARRYALGPRCLVVTSSEDGLAGCVLVRATEERT
jgi:3-oxoacyl-[acyl-carrier-protein] synthase-1